MQELKTLEPGQTEFMANGKRYLIESSMSIDRYVFFEKIEIELGFTRAFADIYDQIQLAMKDINAHKQGDAYVKLYNLANGISNIDRKKPNVLRYCALFINEEGEDRRSITEDQINAKISDWSKEGFDFTSFFGFALSSLPGFRERYKKLTQPTSKE